MGRTERRWKSDGTDGVLVNNWTQTQPGDAGSADGMFEKEKEKIEAHWGRKNSIPGMI